MGKYKPKNKAKSAVYLLVAVAGIPVTFAGYLFAVIGYGFSFFVKRIARRAINLGAEATFVVLGVTWAITGVGIKFAYGSDDAVAFGIASCIGLLSVILAFISKTKGGKRSTILVTYPSSLNALFLPPVAAAVITPILGGDILSASVSVNEFILDYIVALFGVDEFFRQTFELEGFSHVIAWFVFSTIGGWLIGSSVYLAEIVIREERED